MAPILKEADSPAATTTATSPASPGSRSPNETPARLQPVPLEIPVTVNGARTVEGSDKREPFAETTQTVLVFPHGAVIRIATPLAPGQLVFLTNEKSKKEVVCQVVKSKSGGSASGYVELQFTEPSPGFWGLRIPGAAAPPPATAPAVPRPAAVPPSAPKAVAPPPPPPAKIPAPAAIAPPVAQVPPPLKPVVAPPPPTTVSAVVAPPPAPKLPEPASVTSAPVEAAPVALVLPPSPHQSQDPVTHSVPKHPAPDISSPATGAHDYSKEIESLFAVPQAPVTPVAPPAPSAPSSPSSEELKQQAARLQQQLGSLLFAEAPAVPAKPAASESELKLESSVDEVAGKLFEIANEPAKPVAVQPEQKEIPKVEATSEPRIAASAPASTFTSFNAKEEEVAIPSWLRPLSQHSETVAEEPAAESASSADAARDESISGNGEATLRPETAVFGGQLLSGDSGESAATAGSKKGLFLGLAAAVVLLAGGGAWYYRQSHPSTTPPPARQSAVTPSLAEPAGTSPEPTMASRSASNAAPVSPSPASARNNSPASTSTSSAPPENRNAHTQARTTQSQPEPEPEPAKPSLGEVRLAAPVVKSSTSATPSGEPLPSFDTPVQNTGTDALAAASHHKGPAAPLPVGGDVKTAQLIHSVPPVYPAMAKSQRVSGNVTLDALIDTSGNVAELKIISGPPLLHRAALEAVKQWKYSPAMLDGAPTSMHLTVTVQFRNQ